MLQTGEPNLMNFKKAQNPSILHHSGLVTALGALALGASLVSLPLLTGCGNGSGGGGSSASTGGSGGMGGEGGMGGMGGGAPADPCNYPHDTEINATDGPTLQDALTKVVPGTLIRLAAGTYEGSFDLTIKGTAEKPIILCGPREAILDGTTQPTSTVLRFQAVDYWIVSGFTITGGRKGIYVETSNDNLLSDLSIHDIGEQAIQLRNGSSRNTLQYSEIQNTGVTDATNAEGIYIGSAFQNGMPPVPPAMADACDENKILYNQFGPGIKTEHIDVKEGTKGGIVRGNTFDGTGITGADSEDSWVAVTGNNYTFAENIGTVTPKDGFQVRSVAPGYGDNNVFEKNTMTVDMPNYGIYVIEIGGNTPMGTVVKCDNQNLGTGAVSNLMPACMP